MLYSYNLTKDNSLSNIINLPIFENGRPIIFLDSYILGYGHIVPVNRKQGSYLLVFLIAN